MLEALSECSICSMLTGFDVSVRYMKQLETVATRVIAATGSFYSARGIGSQASVGAAVDEERFAGKTRLLASLVLAQSERFERLKPTLFLINCLGIETVLCDLYLKRFDLTKGLSFDTFLITVWYKLCRCDHSVLDFKSFSPDDDCFYYHSWRNNVVIAFGTLSSFLT